jgi:hypothetical protein
MHIKALATLVALPLLAACAPEIESTVYLKDATAAFSSGKPVLVPALLRIPQSSEESCNKGLPELIANLKELAPVTGKGKCIEKEGDQLAEIETSMVIVAPPVSVEGAQLFILEVASPDMGDSLDLSFRLTRPLDEIVKALAANSDELQAEFDPARFILTLNNDLQDVPFDLAPKHVFVDGKPGMPESAPVRLDYRGAVEIRFSDVASEYVAAANGYHFATVVNAK